LSGWRQCVDGGSAKGSAAGLPCLPFLRSLLCGIFLSGRVSCRLLLARLAGSCAWLRLSFSSPRNQRSGDDIRYRRYIALLIGRRYRTAAPLSVSINLSNTDLYLSSMGDLTSCGYPTSTSLEVRELTFRNSTRIYFRDRLQNSITNGKSEAAAVEQSHQLQGCRRRSWPR
jgi:hypothetical protein